MSLYPQRVEKGLPVSDGPPKSNRWPDVRDGHDVARQDTGYRIVWEHMDTGRVVVGQYTFPCRDVAQAIAQAMDVLWPEIRHRAMPAREVASPRSGGADRELLVEACACHGAG